MKEISLDYLSTFEKNFSIDKEKHIVILMTIKTFRDRFELYPELKENAKLFALYDDWEEEGIFFMTTLDFRMMTFCCSVRNVYREMLFELQNEMNLIIHEDTDCICLHLTLEKALELKYEIPLNSKIKELSTEYVDKINNAWPHRFEQSELFIDYSIKYHISMGLFDSNDNLIAWCLRYDNGSLGVLQVDQKHLRKGFGEIVVRAMIKKIAEFCNCDIISLVVSENVKSMNLG
ncbi:hypothetical protein PVAND_017651 [Polypedilum vanderplanki]|uniref:GCN5-related N-acetyltransferase Rv2170-like domain-containing protein n=1 Tax=Polypedilum vanderplanki TaxID=319348 RepID=A0A9J6B995_POLVA|nr:hypothetical protein PVAND_017651 [Polypedilum vanderplanki]